MNKRFMGAMNYHEAFKNEAMINEEEEIVAQRDHDAARSNNYCDAAEAQTVLQTELASAQDQLALTTTRQVHAERQANQDKQEPGLQGN
jgi:hypothetical protein